jgi:hypothetical protein
MRPRIFAIVIFALLAGSLALRCIFVQFNVLPDSEEAVLKKTVAVSVTYFDGGQSKSHRISDPEQLADLLSALKIKDNDHFPFGLNVTKTGDWPEEEATVVFEFANGMSRSHDLWGPRILGVYAVDGQFHKKLQSFVSSHEGHEVDILAPAILTSSIVPAGSPTKKD